jgi:hypothetical protein
MNAANGSGIGATVLLGGTAASGERLAGAVAAEAVVLTSPASGAAGATMARAARSVDISDGNPRDGL